MWSCGSRGRRKQLQVVDGSGSVKDTYQLDAWGHQIASTGSTQNPYKYGAAWGYITDPSGLLQLGARFYWPKLGRFVQRDPIVSGPNRYCYATDKPATLIDPDGLTPTGAAAPARGVGSAVAAGGAAIASGLLMCGEVAHVLYDLAIHYVEAGDNITYFKRCRTQYEHETAAQDGHPQLHGPWELDDEPDIQCWVRVVETGKRGPCGKREHRYLKICWRRRHGDGWGNWHCNDDNGVPGAGMRR